MSQALVNAIIIASPILFMGIAILVFEQGDNNDGDRKV
jgi:hypothetical protein